MKIKFFPVFLLFLMGSLSAQNFVITKSSSGQLSERVSLQDTVNILAIMVSFKADDDGATFGNGKFGSIYSSNYGNTILDPLPHDKQYFEDHLFFTQNYFKKVSGNKLFINYLVLADTFSVPQTMRNYAPEPGSDDFTPLGNFAEEAWTIAAQMYPGLNFQDYDLFTIFHAGVGRDISLPGSIGNERDLPSVYLGPNTFKSLFGNDYEGISLPGTDFKIPNTMIIPETESRELDAINGTVLFEITINGLIAASIGSYLGVPDLFDTETGLSAIGRFGLMDGQGIFAYGGTYPPEPSPWTKIQLGWLEPKIVELENTDVSVVTRMAADIDDTVVVKIPINSSEYFLIENRNRDANSDGSIVTYKSDGVISSKTFTDDTAGYQSYDVDSLQGVIIDVDEYDWAVPGNGILIWHIDESIINNNISSNTVNIDKDKRGVDIEEADGIQDIGETFISIFGDEVIGEGTDEDLWHANNPGRFFENRFDKNTRPNSNSNSEANSLITLTEFSEINNRMSFKVEFGDSIVKPFLHYDFGQATLSDLNILEDGGLIKFAVQNESELIITDGQIILDRIVSFSSDYKTAALTRDQNSYVIGFTSSRVNYWFGSNNNYTAGRFGINKVFSTSPSIRETLNGELEVIFGTTAGIVYIYDLDAIVNNNPLLKDSLILNSTQPIKKISFSPERITFIDEHSIFLDNTIIFNDDEDTLLDLVTTLDKDGNFITIVLTASRRIYVFSNDDLRTSFQLPADFYPGITLTDLRNDGDNYIIANNGNQIAAYNLAGFVAYNFPINSSEDALFFPALSADIEGDSKSELIVLNNNYNLYAINGGNGRIIEGFPFSFSSSGGFPVLFEYNSKICIASIVENKIIKAWYISSVASKIYWKEQFADPQNSSFLPAAENTNRINEFFPTNRAYNYPNPVYDGETFIRYFVSEDSRINIKIFDLAGDYVAELNDEAQGGMDNETTWNVSDIQSGVYLARIEATGISGQSEFAIIKIAVVK